MKLIDALLLSAAGPEIRAILRLHSEEVFTEVLYVRLQRVASEESFCEIRACIAKIEGGSLAQDAVDVVFRCLDVTCLDWHSGFLEKNDIPDLHPIESEIEIDTQDSFRILCRAIEVSSVRLDKLGESVDIKNA